MTKYHKRATSPEKRKRIKKLHVNADKYFEKLQFGRALDCYEEIEDIEKSDMILLLNSSLYIMKGDYKTALNKVNTVLQHVPQHPVALFVKAFIFENMKKPSKTQACFSKIVKIQDPKPEGIIPIFPRLKGLAFKKMGRFDEAIEIFKQAIEIEPKEKSNYINMSICYANKMDFESAIDSIKSIFHENLNDVDINFYWWQYKANDLEIKRKKGLIDNMFYTYSAAIIHSELNRFFQLAQKQRSGFTHVLELMKDMKKESDMFGVLVKVLMD